MSTKNEPVSFITKNKQRIKQYNDIVYLNDGDEFEIEFFNPTNNHVLAKIELNGKELSSGIVIKPGQRYFLDRFLDEPRKFLFDTYEVEGNNKEVKEAISKNGLVKISFYPEKVNRDVKRLIPYNGLRFVETNNQRYTKGFQASHTVTTDNLNAFTTNTTTNVFLSNVGNSLTNTGELRSASFTLSKSANIETGMVEKGSVSEQEFGIDWRTYSQNSSNVITWKILPQSIKPIEVSEIVTYCTECGAKRKKDTHKFCPHCGTKY
jgi:hypothetical protein